LDEELKRRDVKGIKSVAIGGRGGQNVLVVAVSDAYKGEIPRAFAGIKVEIENFGNLERY
jgi:hypothetical protein